MMVMPYEINFIFLNINYSNIKSGFKVRGVSVQCCNV